MDLEVVHVISRPSAQWAGERGRIDAVLLDRLLPEQSRSLQYFICAGEGMVDAVEGDLDWLGVPRDRIHSDRFGMV